MSDENASESANETTSETQNQIKSDKQKVDILLKPTGNAPIMKKKKWTVDADKQLGWITEFVRKYLKLEPEEQLFLYVNQTFAPSPDQIVRNLYDCYNTEGSLTSYEFRGFTEKGNPKIRELDQQPVGAVIEWLHKIRIKELIVGENRI